MYKIKPPALWASFLLSRLFPEDERVDLLGDYEEYFVSLAVRKGRLAAVLWYGLQIVLLSGRSFYSAVKWGGVMFFNVIKLAFRHVRRQKSMVAMNLAGLAVGLACAFFVLLYVHHNYSFDRFHPDADRVYRIVNRQTTHNGIRQYASVTVAMAPDLQADLPQIENIVRILDWEPKTVAYEDEKYRVEHIAYTDPGLQNVLGLRCLKGRLGGALQEPGTAVITQSEALRFFGDTDPVGKLLQMDGHTLAVQAVIEDMPAGSHLALGILISFESIKQHNTDAPPHFLEWGTGHGAHTYLKVAPATDITALEAQINAISQAHLEEQLKRYGYEHHYTLQNIADIHLTPGYRGEFKPAGNRDYLMIFMGIGVLILSIACVNYINLATARASNRAAEIGMRKALGSTRRQMAFHFVTESLVMTLAAALLALFLMALTLKGFNGLAESRFTLGSLLRPDLLAAMGGITLLAGLIAGLYPAIFLSGLGTLAMLSKSVTRGKKSAALRQVLVIGQMMISVLLIVGALVINGQIHHMKHAALGFDKRQKWVVALPEIDLMRRNYPAVKSELMSHPGIEAATASSTVPGHGAYFWRMWPTGQRAEKSQPLNFMNVDYDFINTYGLELVAGQPFRLSAGGEEGMTGWIVNEAAVEAYGWDSPEAAVGQLMMEDKTPILGVVRNFHFKGVQNPVEAMGMSIWSGHFQYLTLQVDVNRMEEVRSHVSHVMETFFPGLLYTSFFLDEDFNRQYLAEEQVGRLFSVFTGLGIFIAVLGLLGLTAYVVERKTREIGIRKVLGASVQGLTFHLVKDLLKWVAIANVLAWPLAWHMAGRWLDDFAVRMELGWGLFLLAGGISFVIALVSVGSQTVRAASADPVQTLRYE